VVRKKEDETNKRLMSRLSPTKKKPQENVQLFPGDAVRLKGQTVAGKILEIQGKKAWVVFGSIKSTVAIDKLEKVSQSQLKKEMKEAIPDSNMRELMHERKLKFKPDLDVRGMRGDEALQAVMYFIDDAIQLGISRVRILHGTGSGALRQIIREYLTTVNGVTHFQDEHVEFGGAGITVVDLE